jgi:DNA polymerase III delta subunit
MLYLLHGNDFVKKRAKLGEILALVEENRSGVSVFKLSEEDFLSDDGANKLRELVSSQVLFGGNYVVVLENILEVAPEEVQDKLVEMADSAHIFIFVEEALKTPKKKLFEKAGAKIEALSMKPVAKSDFNIFSLADALAGKDKKKLWFLYQKALKEEFAPEEIAGTLFWQIKTLLLVSGGDTSSMKPYSISKAKKALPKWSEAELKKTSGKLIGTYHNARRGGPALKEGLELFLLKI